MCKAIACLLFTIAMLTWGLIIAVLLASIVGHWTEEHWVLMVFGFFVLAFLLKEAYWWIANAPWKLKS